MSSRYSHFSRCLAPTRRTLGRRITRGLMPAMLATLIVAGASPWTVHAGEPPLTLAEAQRRAVERSRQVSAQDHAVAAAREMAVAAGQLPDPVLKVCVDNFPVEGPDRYSVARDSMTMRRIGVMQEITRMVGGMVTAPLLSMFVVPAAYLLIGRLRARQSKP